MSSIEKCHKKSHKEEEEKKTWPNFRIELNSLEGTICTTVCVCVFIKHFLWPKYAHHRHAEKKDKKIIFQFPSYDFFM